MNEVKIGIYFAFGPQIAKFRGASALIIGGEFPIVSAVNCVRGRWTMSVGPVRRYFLVAVSGIADPAVAAGPTKPLQERYMPKGTVKWFNATKGYGFIEPEDGGKDAFVHISAVERAGLSGLREGQKVEFDLVSDQRGRPSADNLKALD